MEQQSRQNLWKKLWYISIFIVGLIIFYFFINTIIEFFGRCVGMLVGATISTSIILYSLLSRKYKDKGEIYIALGYIIPIVILWILVYLFCVDNY